MGMVGGMLVFWIVLDSFGGHFGKKSFSNWSFQRFRTITICPKDTGTTLRARRDQPGSVLVNLKRYSINTGIK